MRSSHFGTWIGILALLIVPGAWSQSITTDDNIETEGQLVSTVGKGTAPLAISSTTTVRNLSADYLDGKHGNDFALGAELLAAIESLDKPDSLCFDASTRFVNCGNGTVADTATGLIWLEKADCRSISDCSTVRRSIPWLETATCRTALVPGTGGWRRRRSGRAFWTRTAPPIPRSLEMGLQPPVATVTTAVPTSGLLAWRRPTTGGLVLARATQPKLGPRTWPTALSYCPARRLILSCGRFAVHSDEPSRAVTL